MKGTNLLVLLALSAPVAVQGQGRPVGVGGRVRISAPNYVYWRVAGQIDNIDSDTIVVDTAVVNTTRFWDPGPRVVDAYRRVRIPTNKIDRLEISRGKSRVWGAFAGAWKGAMIASVIEGVTGMSGELAAASSLADIGRGFGRGAMRGAVTGGLLGLGIGVSIGHERWRRVAVTTLRPPTTERSISNEAR